MSVKIFVVHHKASNVFRNSVFEPIQTGADFTGVDLGFLKDNTGDNIAVKNPFWGELTAWYWVLKNWLPVHPEVTSVGFCHYRRVIDITTTAKVGSPPFKPISWNRFENKFQSQAYSEELFEQMSHEYDVFLPGKDSLMSFRHNFIGNVYDQFVAGHPKSILDNCVDFAIKRELASSTQVRMVLGSSAFHSCLNFILRRDLFESLSNWMFQLLGGIDVSNYKKLDLPYNEIRTPAFVAERFFDIWLSQQLKGLRIKECDGYFIGNDPYPHNIAWFLSGLKQWLLWKGGLKEHTPLPTIIV